LAVGGLFSSGADLAFATIGFLATIALVVGSISAIANQHREGAGSAITAQISTIILSVLILLSVGIAAMVTREFNNHRLRSRLATAFATSTRRQRFRLSAGKSR
jgi:hypothetical protein